MPTTRLLRTSLVWLIVMALLLVAAGPVLARKGDRAKGDKDGSRPEAASPAVIDSIAGDRYKMAQAKMADRITRVTDAAKDQVMGDGSPVVEPEPWSDIAAVYLAPVKVPGKLLTKMDEDFPRGAVGAFYGTDADWSKLDRALFVAVELAGKRPSDAVQQVEVGLDGDGAGPLEVGAASDTRAGLETFSLSGTFGNGSETSGTTDVSGRRPGQAIEYYNTESGVFGYYDPKQQTYFLIVPLASDAQSASVALRTVTPGGEVVDRLELPGGGHLVPLADPAGGWEASSGDLPLACRSLETFSPASGQPGLDGPGTTRIRYTVAADPALDAAQAQAQLAALDALGDSAPLTLLSAAGDGEPLRVDATISRAPALRAISLTVDVPPGQWTLAEIDQAAPRTPAGEALIDARSLTGRAGVRTGDGLDGFVAGDPGCGRLDLGVEACALVPADEMAGLVGFDSSEIEQASVRRSDGAAWCVGTATASGEVQYIARFGTDYLTSSGFASLVEASDCEAQSLALGAEGITLDCGAQGFERHVVRVLPDVIAAADPDGGLLLSVDMLVDRSKPYGQRYDPAAAATILGDMVEAVATSARPAGESGTPAAEGEEPAADGDQPAAEGDEPAAEGDEPAADADEPAG